MRLVDAYNQNAIVTVNLKPGNALRRDAVTGRVCGFTRHVAMLYEHGKPFHDITVNRAMIASIKPAAN